MGAGNIHQITLTPGNYDGGGRLRVSEITELGEYKFLNGTLNSSILQTTGSATFTPSGSGNLNRYNMTVVSGSYGIIASKKYHPYLNGKSQLIELTTSNFGTASFVEKSVGYISSDATVPFNTGLDGFRLISSGSTYAIEVWRNGTKTINSLQSNWTLDKLDGTGPSSTNPSGYNINNNNFQWFGFDFLYLGGTAIRCFTFINGSMVEFNAIPWAGSSNADSNPIFNSPNKPIRYEIRGISGSGNMDFVCSLIASEGQMVMPDQQIVVQGPIAGISGMSAGVTYAVAGVRKSTTFRDIKANIIGMEGIINTNDMMNLELRLNPTIAGSFTWAALSGTPFETFTGSISNTVSGGTIISNTYFSLNMNNPKSLETISTELNSTLGNVMDQMILCVTPVLGSTNVKATATMQVSWLNA